MENKNPFDKAEKQGNTTLETANVNSAGNTNMPKPETQDAETVSEQEQEFKEAQTERD